MTRFFLFALFLALASGAAAQTSTGETDDIIDTDDVYDDMFEIETISEVTVDPATRVRLSALRDDDGIGSLLILLAHAMSSDAQPSAAMAHPDAWNAPARQALVRFEVSGTASGAATDFLVALADARSLGSLSAASTPEGDTSVEAQFSFASVAEWAAWRALPETEAMLERLSGGAPGVRTELTVMRLDR